MYITRKLAQYAVSKVALLVSFVYSMYGEPTINLALSLPFNLMNIFRPIKLYCKKIIAAGQKIGNDS